MKTLSATAQANPNIAFIKYWGNRDQALRLPSTGSIYMNLDSLFTRIRVTFSASFGADSLRIGSLSQANTILGWSLACPDQIQEYASPELFDKSLFLGYPYRER